MRGSRGSAGCGSTEEDGAVVYEIVKTTTWLAVQMQSSKVGAVGVVFASLPGVRPAGSYLMYLRTRRIQRLCEYEHEG